MNLLLAFALTLLAAVLISAWTERTILSTTVLFLAVGLWLGRESWATAAVSTPLLRVVADLALFGVLFTDGMRAGGTPSPPGAVPLVVRAMGLGMPLTILGIAALAHYLTALPWLESWLLGAALSPTDPIFVSALLNNEAIPPRLRRLLNVESGINDGVALPPVLILLGEIGAHPASPAIILLELAAGVVIGVAVPWLGLRLEASRFLGSAGVFRQLNAFALGLVVLALSWRLNANVYLAAFAAGISVARFSPEVRRAFEDFGELIAELFKLAAIMVFGMMMAPRLFTPLSGAQIGFILLALFAVRMAAIELAMLGSRLDAGERLVAGWLGPKGFASVVYGVMIIELGTPLAPIMAHLVGMTIVVSIVVYSSTDLLVARWFAARAQTRTR